MKGLTRDQATQIARTFRLSGGKKYTIWYVDGEVKFTYTERVDNTRKHQTFLTTSWKELREQDPRLTQAKLSEMIYRMVNGKINQIKVEAEREKDAKPMIKDEYISKDELLGLVRAYVDSLDQELSRDEQITDIRYRRTHDIVYLGSKIDRLKASFPTDIKVYGIELGYWKTKEKGDTNTRINLVVNEAYPIINKTIKEYWEELYEDYRDEL